MKVLELNRQSFILLWIFPTPKTDGKLIKFRNILISLIHLYAIIASLIFSIGFAYKYVKIDLENTLYALFQIAAYGSQSYSMVIGYKLGSKIAQLFPKLQQIYDSSN